MRWLIFIALAASCSKNQDPPPPSSGSPNAQPESGPRRHGGTENGREVAQKMYDTVCTTCHGSDGSGNGQMAKNLPVKPRNYTDATWQASVTDADIKKIILGGGASVGKSPMMPGQPQLTDQPEVLDGLVQIIRGFAKK